MRVGRAGRWWARWVYDGQWRVSGGRGKAEQAKKHISNPSTPDRKTTPTQLTLSTPGGLKSLGITLSPAARWYRLTARRWSTRRVPGICGLRGGGRRGERGEGVSFFIRLISFAVKEEGGGGRNGKQKRTRIDEVDVEKASSQNPTKRNQKLTTSHLSS